MIRRTLYILLATVFLGAIGVGVYMWSHVILPQFIATAVKSAPRPPETVSAEEARKDEWQPQISGIGTLTAFEGIDVTPQVGGIVKEIQFESGQDVKKGDLLIKLDTATEEADMRSLEAQLANAESDLARKQALANKGISPRAELDQLRTTRDTLNAAIQRLRALVAQKFIYAPWDGRVGIKTIALGSYLAPGQKIVWLQKIDPVYADFSVTEADFGRISIGQKVTATFSAYADQVFEGKIVTTDTRVSDQSRMITVRAELANPDKKLVPGMYANVLVESGDPVEVVTVPQTAVTFSLYGDNVLVAVPSKEQPKDGPPTFDIERRFVKAGEVRDDRVSIRSGLNPGDKVVTAGQNKIDQGSKVVIDNSIALKQQDTSIQ
jgi:membrane fusion protein, multidrug efflux system